MRSFTSAPALALSVAFSIASVAPAIAAAPSTSPPPESTHPISAGLTSNELFLHTGATALTGLFPKTATMDLQVDFVIPQTDPFLWGLSGELKNTIHGSRDLGFHLGGGLGVGQFAEDRLFLRVGALAGFHWAFLTRLAVHVDGGLTFAYDDADEAENQLHLTGHSSHFGISLFYKFD